MMHKLKVIIKDRVIDSKDAYPKSSNHISNHTQKVKKEKSLTF